MGYCKSGLAREFEAGAHPTSEATGRATELILLHYITGKLHEDTQIQISEPYGVLHPGQA